MHAGPSLRNPASRSSYFFLFEHPTARFAITVTVIAVLTILRATFATTIDLRIDEAYYWTWSKESVLSYLDHPPMIAWCIRFGTLLFDHTNFGVVLQKVTGWKPLLVPPLGHDFYAGPPH